MSTSRLRQVSTMYSEIAKVSLKEATNAVLSTPTGKAISDNNSAVLYEQPSSNLLDIFSELSIEKRPKYDIQAVLNAEAQYKPHHFSQATYHPTKGKTITIHSKPSLKSLPAFKKAMHTQFKDRYTVKVKAFNKSVRQLRKEDIYADQSQK